MLDCVSPPGVAVSLFGWMSDSPYADLEVICLHLQCPLAFDLGPYATFVLIADFVDASSIEVFVCRYQSSSNDCSMP